MADRRPHAERLADTCSQLTGEPPFSCARCADELPRTKSGRPFKNRRWCSPDCEHAWAREHVWQVARDAALNRDGHRCVRSDRHEDEATVRAALAPQVDALDPALDGDMMGDDWRRRHRARTNLNRELRRRIGALDLEVNHIVPRNGDGYGVGCWHHLDNLETLCRSCHVEETTRQRRGLPSWRHDPRPIDVIEGRAVLPFDERER